MIGAGAGTNGVSASTLSPVATLKNALGATETARGTVVALSGDVLFAYDKADVQPGGRARLDQLADLVTAQKPKSILIEGHSDAKGNDAYNLALSQRRAMAVRDYLISVKTLDGTIMTARGIGELRPVAPNARPDGADNPDGRTKNRRVEVVLK